MNGDIPKSSIFHDKTVHFGHVPMVLGNPHGREMVMRDGDVDLFDLTRSDCSPFAVRDSGNMAARRYHVGLSWNYPLVNVYSLRTGKWPIEIVVLPIKDGDLP